MTAKQTLPLLNPAQQNWVEETLEQMSLDDCLAHLLCPEDRKYDEQEWRRIVRESRPGAVFISGQRSSRQLADLLAAIQEESTVPVLVAVDMEPGVGVNCEDMTRFPAAMAFGATGQPAMARLAGRAIAREARALGVHWSFAPVIDPQINFQNPVVMTRAYGDRPEMVAEFAAARIQGMQEDNLLAATAKHFPGDGMDDRDQHLCTSINPLPMDQWHQSYGRIWRAAFEAGVMSVMSGHISLPHYTGELEHPEDTLPATLSRPLQVDLLRRELGFEGVIVSDAAPMLGITSRCSAERLAVDNILAGGDCFLFADPEHDLGRLRQAAEKGELSEDRARASARRLLAMKARLGLPEQLNTPQLSQAELAAHSRLADNIAEKAITVLRQDDNLERPPAPGARLLLVDVFHEGRTQPLTVAAAELRQRGYKVDHLSNPGHRELIEKAGDYERVYVNLLTGSHKLIGTGRIVGNAIMQFWRAFWVDAGNAVFTSFGPPWHLYELPHLPNFAVAYSSDPASQRAAVRLWLREIEATGTCPLQLPGFAEIMRTNAAMIARHI